MKGGIALAAGLLLLAATSVQAGVVYRCEGAQGLIFSSTKVKGASCKVASRFKNAPRRSVPPPAPAAAGTIDSTAPQATATQADAKRKQPRFVRMATAHTFSWVDAGGVRHYSNTRPKGVAGVNTITTKYPVFQMDSCYACGASPKLNFGKVRLNTTDYQAEIAAAVREFGVEEAIVRAIIHAESAYRYNAVSRAGAQGLMQLMPATARRFGVSNSFDPAQNIRGGVQYLAWLLKRFNGDLTLAAAGYNAGEGAVDRHGGVPPYSETRRYVQRVAMLADRYRGGLAAQ